MGQLVVITDVQAEEIANEFGTPIFGYNEKILEDRAKEALGFPNAFGLTVRYAMKANPTRHLLRIFDKMGLHIDASSSKEVFRALRAFVDGSKIQLTAQEMPRFHDLENFLRKGVHFTACSLHQLRCYGEVASGQEVTVRINPGLGSGGTNRTNVGGPSSSFGIWHEYMDEVHKLVQEYKLRVTKIHTHIGSGSDPKVWEKVAKLSLGYVEQFPEARGLNLGGGYKIDRMNHENSTDLQECGKSVRDAFVDFEKKTGRKIHLEIEPGTYLVAQAGALVAEVNDVVSTSDYNFIKINAGMTEIARPCLYGAQHPIHIVYLQGKGPEKPFIISGHCCESGDILTPADGDPEGLQPRTFATPEIGDLVVVGGSGAYCSGMPIKNYNSFPEAAEVLIREDGSMHLIRERQTLDQMIANDVDIIGLPPSAGSSTA